MIIDLTNVEETEQEKLPYLARTGKILLKVTKVKDGGITKNGNKVLKVFFKTKEGELYIEEIILTQEALWRLKVLTKALKMPNVVDTDQMVNRYVYGHFLSENYNKNDGTVGTKVVAKSWEPSELTNTMQAEPEKVAPTIETDSDENVPF